MGFRTLVAGWAAGIVGIAAFPPAMLLAGALVMTSAVLLASDGGEEWARITARFGRGTRTAPPYRLMAVLTFVVGVGWAFVGAIAL